LLKLRNLTYHMEAPTPHFQDPSVYSSKHYLIVHCIATTHSSHMSRYVRWSNKPRDW